MFTVSLIGPDGVGKTSIAENLQETFPLPVKYIYMGMNNSAANFSLPTTRLWGYMQCKRQLKKKNSHLVSKSKIKNSSRFKYICVLSKAIRFVRKTLGFINLIFEEWYRQIIAFFYKKFGYIVIFDRHFLYDFYDFDEHKKAKQTKEKIHDFILNKTMLQPDLVICLDAPAEVVYERKKEFKITDLEIKRKRYLNLQSVVKNFELIDANRSFEIVVRDVKDRIIKFHRTL